MGWIFIQWPVSYWNHSPQIWWRGWGGITTYVSLRLSATMEAKLRAQHKQWDFQKSFLKWIYLLILHTHSGAKYEFLLCLPYNYDHGRQTGLKSRGATKIRDLFSKNDVFRQKKNLWDQWLWDFKTKKTADAPEPPSLAPLIMINID